MDETRIDTLTIEIGASSDKAVQQINGVAGALKRLRGNTSHSIKVDTKDVDKAHKKVSALGNILSSLKRIAFYRVIRSAIKAVTQAFSEGAENAYWYSKTIGDQTKYIAEAYDSLSSGSFKMSNQLGAAWATLKAAIAPVLIEIINLVTAAANAITQLFAVLGGRGTYLKAIDYTKEWADTTKKGGAAAKEWKNQLMGFDEINRLNEPSSGGGGSGSALPDYENMFEEANISDMASRIVESIKNGDWGTLGETISEKAIEGVNEASKKIHDFDFWEFASNLFGGISDYLDGFDVGGLVNSLSGLFSEAIVGLADFINGAVDSDLISSISDFISRAIEGVDHERILGSLTYLVTTIITNIPVIALRLLAFVSDRLEDLFRFLGLESVAGFFGGISEKLRNAATWLKENFVNPIVDAVKELFGIHSPSKVFADIGEDIVQGLWNGIKEKWDGFLEFFNDLWEDLKSWWEGLSLGAFHIPAPHFDWTYTEASGAIARALEFVGLPSTIPHLNISWYAKGGIVDGATLIGAGENGKEAIIPLERNTEWISKVASEMNAQMRNDGDSNAVSIEDGINNSHVIDLLLNLVGTLQSFENTYERSDKRPKVYLDSREIKAGQERLARAWG